MVASSESLTPESSKDVNRKRSKYYYFPLIFQDFLLGIQEFLEPNPNESQLFRILKVRSDAALNMQIVKVYTQKPTPVMDIIGTFFQWALRFYPKHRR